MKTLTMMLIISLEAFFIASLGGTNVAAQVDQESPPTLPKVYQLDSLEKKEIVDSGEVQCKILKKSYLGYWIEYEDGVALIEANFLPAGTRPKPQICSGPPPAKMVEVIKEQTDSLPQQNRMYSKQPQGWKVLLDNLWESEIPGAENNWKLQHIIDHAMKSTGIYLPPEWVSDKLPSCAVAVIYAESASGKDVSSLNFKAISFLKYGTAVESLEKAKFGDIIVLYRFSPERWESHVGYLMGVIGNNVMLLGGNQDDRIGIDAFPISKIRADGIRRPPP